MDNCIYIYLLAYIQVLTEGSMIYKCLYCVYTYIYTVHTYIYIYTVHTYVYITIQYYTYIIHITKHHFVPLFRNPLDFTDKTRSPHLCQEPHLAATVPVSSGCERRTS